MHGRYARRMATGDLDDAPFDAHTLRVVKAIADLGSITAAADALGYSQPAISQHLRRVEQRAGVPVIERVGRGVRLTDAGRVLAQHAPAVMSALDAAAGELAELRGLRAGRVRIAAFPSASSTVVPRLLAEIAERHPGVSVTYTESEPPEAVAAVREDRVDIAFTFSYPGDRDDPHRASASGLSVRTVGADELMLLLPASHPVARTPEVDLAALGGEDWVAGCPRCRGHLLELCGRAGFAPRIAIETDNVVAVEGLVARGVGVATLPRMAISSFPLLEGVVVRPLPPGEERRLHIVAAHRAERVPAVRVALAALERAIATVSAAG
jgi:molybdate transport repressor ModE-like protein